VSAEQAEKAVAFSILSAIKGIQNPASPTASLRRPKEEKDYEL